MRRSHAERAAVAGALIVTLVCGSLPASAQRRPVVRAEAQPYLTRALRHYDAHEYAAAAQAIREAHTIDPRPELLYMWAQSERLSGDCAAAVPLYRRFLETSPADEERARAEKNLGRCETATAPSLTAPATDQPRATVVVEVPPVKPRGPWYRDRWGVVLGGSALVALGVAGGLELAARRSLADARQAADYRSSARGAEAATDRHHAALAATAVGSALLLSALVQFVVRAATK